MTHASPARPKRHDVVQPSNELIEPAREVEAAQQQNLGGGIRLSEAVRRSADRLQDAHYHAILGVVAVITDGHSANGVVGCEGDLLACSWINDDELLVGDDAGR